MTRPTVSFNGKDFATYVTGLIVIGRDPYRAANRVVNNSPLAGSNKSVTTSAWFTGNKMNIKVEIGRNTRELLDDSIDQLRALLHPREAALVTNYGSSSRQWTATYSNYSVSEVEGGHATIEIEFICSDPYGYAVTPTTLFSSTRTGSSSTDNFIVGGSAEFQVPVITIVFNAVTGGTLKDVVVGNPNTGQQVTITNTFATADVLVIDSRNKIITLNGDEILGVGALPQWEAGPGSLDYSDTLTTRNYTISAEYYKRY